MKEKPILFSGPMVRAILEGRKTQTRRVIKPQPDLSILKESARGLEFEFRRMPALGPTHTPAEWGFVPKYDKPDCMPIFGYSCPWKVGMKLWVRETFRIPEYHEYDDRVEVEYRANHPTPDELKWKPSIFMPRKFSRITLEITGVRAERLNDISEMDAMAEGCKSELSRKQDLISGRWCDVLSYKKGFESIWDSINGKSYPWSSCPWVWVIEFKII